MRLPPPAPQATFSSDSRSAARLVLCRPRASMPRGPRLTTATRVAIRSTTGYSASRVSGVCCLESLSAERARTSRGPRRSRSKSTAAATNGPARQPRPASSAPATKRTPSARSCWNSLRPVRRLGLTLALGLAAPVSATGLQDADALGRPVGGKGATDDPLARDGTPEAAVVGLATVVAHHEPVVGGNGDRPGEVAPRPALAGPREAVLLALAVDVRVPALDVQRVARAGDDALDEVDLGLLAGRAVAGLVGLLVGVAARVRVRAG